MIVQTGRIKGRCQATGAKEIRIKASDPFSGHRADLCRGRKDPDSLAEVERVRYLAYAHNLIDNREVAYYAHFDGVLTDQYWLEWDPYYKNQMKRRPRFAWTENRYLFVGPLAKYVDDFMANGYSQ